jgi:hypothetical protein
LSPSPPSSSAAGKACGKIVTGSRRDSVHVLISVDESTYDPRGYSVPGGSPPMGDHPISWCQPYDGGRAFYTALGHKGAYWSEPLLLSHVLGGIEMAAGKARFNCGQEDD